MSNLVRHPYHLVDESPWPLVRSFGGLFVTAGILSWFHLNNMSLFIVALLILSLTMFQWWRDISREGRAQGHHAAIVELGLR